MSRMVVRSILPIDIGLISQELNVAKRKTKKEKRKIPGKKNFIYLIIVTAVEFTILLLFPERSSI